jgi:hypothetical protein
MEQFGDGDKYFGVATVLSTLPGLPMFGHGQVEGFREKYGMEFRKPKWDEITDAGLIAGHEWKIFPVLHRRYLFADVENFLLYDFYTADSNARMGGSVDENVFAYSNVYGDERGVVIYHNRFADTKGWIKISAAYLDKQKGDLRQKSLAEGLGLPFEGYVIFKDYVTHLEYIRSSEELWQKGLYLELHAYQHHVFMDWRFADDPNWEKVRRALNGAGVESMKAQWEEMFGVEEEVAKPVKVKKPRKKAGAKKPASSVKLVPKRSATKETTKKTAAGKESLAKKTVAKVTKSIKKATGKAVAVAKKVTTKRPKSTAKKSSSKKSTARKTSKQKTSTQE